MFLRKGLCFVLLVTVIYVYVLMFGTQADFVKCFRMYHSSEEGRKTELFLTRFGWSNKCIIITFCRFKLQTGCVK